MQKKRKHFKARCRLQQKLLTDLLNYSFAVYDNLLNNSIVREEKALLTKYTSQGLPEASDNENFF